MNELSLESKKSRLFASIQATKSFFTPAHLFSLLFAIVYQLPNWPKLHEQIYGREMADRFVYENKILNYDLITDYIFDFSPIGYFTNEWAWNSALAYLNRELALHPETIFLVISTLVLWRFAYEVTTRAGWIYTILLLNPLVVGFAFSQIRLATAIAILSFVWRGQRGLAITVAIYGLCAAIHTSVVLLAAIHYVVRRFSAPNLRTVALLVSVGVAVSVVTGPLREAILLSLDDRRAVYSDISSTPAYLSFWIVMWALMIYKRVSTLSSIDGRYALVILSIVATNLVIGGYSTRFIVLAMPSLIIAMSRLPSQPVSLLIALYVPYALLQWLYYLRIL